MTTKISTLENGLRVVTDTIDSVETAALGVWVNVGTRNESKNINGISHLLEHMAFKGTVRFSAREIAERIEAVGGHLNAYTSRESTAYYARFLAQDMPLAIDLLSDILQFSVFQEEELERERAVILQEIGQAQDSPDEAVFDEFQRTAFPNQPIGRPIAGTEDIVRSITRETLKKYMESHYAASSMILAAAGKVDHDEIVGLAEEKFSHLQQQNTLLVEPAHYEGGDFRRNRDLEQVHLILGFPGLPLGHTDHYTAALLATVLGGGMSSRLFQEIREKRGLVYSIYSFVSSYSDVGVFGLYAGTGEKEVSEMLPVICEELNQFPLSLKGPEIERAKAQLKAGLMMALESTTTRCEQLAQQMMVYGRPLSPAEITDRIEAVEPEHIAQLAQTLFSQKPTLTALGPLKNLEPYEILEKRLPFGDASLPLKVAGA